MILAANKYTIISEAGVYQAIIAERIKCRGAAEAVTRGCGFDKRVAEKILGLILTCCLVLMASIHFFARNVWWGTLFRAVFGSPCSNAWMRDGGGKLDVFH